MAWNGGPSTTILFGDFVEVAQQAQLITPVSYPFGCAQLTTLVTDLVVSPLVCNV